MLKQALRQCLTRLQPGDPLWHVHRNTLIVRGVENLMSAMSWKSYPQLDAPHLDQFEYLEDLNQRRRRDAEAVMAACCNVSAGSTILEIGTAEGLTTAMMSVNAPEATIYTVNIPPEEIAAGGHAVTYAPSREEIGRAYRQAGCRNVKQILANTATWTPDIGTIEMAFLDGCHDTEFVFSDTCKVLAHCRVGSQILWHDFSPHLVQNYDWIRSVCQGVEQLYQERLISGRILHPQDSWIGMYIVNERDIDAAKTFNGRQD